MNIFDLFIPFWQESEREPFTTTEVALYHYLLNEANRNRWVMPFRCSTTIACYRLSTSRQNIQKARESLRNRGFIDFKIGIGKNKPAEYIILQLTGQLPTQLTQQLSEELPHYKIKDIESDLSLSRAKNEEQLSISAIRETLLKDTEWQATILSLLAEKGESMELKDLLQQIEQFLLTLSARGIKSKSNSDCRSHFYNWLCLQIENEKNHNYDKHINPRRGVDVPTPSEQNYEGAF